MAVKETLTLDLSQALSQLDDLERELDALLQPIVIPVEVETDQALDQLRRDIRAADDDDIDIDVDVDGVARAEDEFEELRREVDRTDDGLEKVERQAKKTGDDLERAGKKGKSAFSGLTKGLLAFGAALGGIAALRGLATFFGEAIDAASDLEESTSKAQVVFGNFFDDIRAFASTAPQALGLANAAALEFTGTFGNLFVALGLSQQAAADLAPEIVQLGADLASFNNIEVTDALDKLRAGLVGEAEPLRALGVNLTAATTNAKAMELGLVGLDGVITEAAKVQARYVLILEQTATAQGDFARTSDGLANQQRTLAGEFENFRAAVGEALIPAFQAVLDLAPALVDAIEQGLVPAVESFAAAVASVDTDALATDLAQLPSAIGAVFGDINAATGTLINFGQALGNISRFEFGDALDQIGQAFDDFQSIAARGTARQAIQDLIVTLGKGVEPGQAFESVLIDLGKSVDTLNLEQFESLVDQLVAIANLDDVDIASQVTSIRALGTAAGFSEAGVDILVKSLLEARSAAGTLPPPLDEIARGLERAGKAGSDAAPGIDDLAVALEELRRARIDEIIASLEAQFDRLPDALDGAAAAMRDAENEIVTDFTDFLDSLDAELAAREDFAANIATLIGLGLEGLADVFEEAGLESAAALVDALANPAELAAAEARLEAFGRALASAEALAFLAQIQTEIDSASDFIVEITPVLGDLDFGGLPVLPNIVIPGTGQGGGGTTVNQFFPTTPSPTTDTARAAQAANNIE